MPTTILPLQQIPTSEKTQEWFKSNAEYFISQSVISERDDDVRKLYNAVDGIIDEDYYKHVHNPYNSDSDKWKSLPAKIKYFNIIEPVIQSIVGEKGREPDMVRIICTNNDVVNEYLQVLNNKILDAVIVDFNKVVNAFQSNRNIDDIPLNDYQQIAHNHKLTYRARRTIMASDAWDYLKENLKYSDIKQQLAFDFIVTGKAFTYKYVYKDEVYEEVVPPDELTIFCAPNTTNVTDAFAVIRHQEIPVSQVIDRYRDMLDSETLTNLEQSVNQYTGTGVNDFESRARLNRPNNLNYAFNERYAHNVVVWHVQWKGRRLIQKRYYQEGGIEFHMEVDEDYTLKPELGDIRLEKEYVTHIYEYFRLGDKTYFGDHKNPHSLLQRHLLTNVSKVHFSYDGIINKGRSGKINSIVKLALPYQALYNTYKFRTEMVMAVNKDKIMLIPKGLKPKNWTMDEWLYYIQVTRMAFIDDTNDKIATLIQAIKSVDLSLGNYIGDMIRITDQIREEFWSAVGFNRQRMGDIHASDGKATTNEALFRSSLVTSEYLRKLASFEREDVQGLLDLSKVAWRNGKKRQILTSEGRNIMLDIDGLDWTETEIGVFVKNSSSEVEKVETLKSLLQPMAQNDMSKGLIADVLDETNYEKIKEIMHRADEVQRKFLMEQTEKANQVKREELDQNKEIFEREDATKRYVADITANGRIQAENVRATTALLQSMLGLGAKDGDGDGILNETFNSIQNVDIEAPLDANLQAYTNFQKDLQFKYEQLKENRKAKQAKS